MNKEVYKKILAAREKKNENLKHASFEMETSTHFPVLMKAVRMTMGEGPVLEVGSGLFSTPLLHWMCFESGRELITCERYLHYMDFAQKFRTASHAVLHVPDMRGVDFLNRHFSVVFIDHTPKKPRTRGDDALLFKDTADYVVLHDAGADAKEKYGYAQLYPYFKYRYDFTGAVPHTTVLSNFKDLSVFS